MRVQKKRGVFLFVNGLILVIAGILVFINSDLPSYWPTLIVIAGLVFDVFGFKFVFPDR